MSNGEYRENLPMPTIELSGPHAQFLSPDQVAAIGAVASTWGYELLIPGEDTRGITPKPESAAAQPITKVNGLERPLSQALLDTNVVENIMHNYRQYDIESPKPVKTLLEKYRLQKLSELLIVGSTTARSLQGVGDMALSTIQNAIINIAPTLLWIWHSNVSTLITAHLCSDIDNLPALKVHKSLYKLSIGDILRLNDQQLADLDSSRYRVQGNAIKQSALVMAQDFTAARAILEYSWQQQGLV